MLKNRQRGFTLLEILVVISIIGILVALGTAAFSTTQQKGRDARRKSDIKAIQNGFEQYQAKLGVYPSNVDDAEDETTIFPGGLPTDPRDEGESIYTINLADETYCACALLENSFGNAASLPAGGNPVCDYSGGSGNYYCLGNLQ